MKYDARACHFNMDTGCVELLLRDGRMISMRMPSKARRSRWEPRPGFLFILRGSRRPPCQTLFHRLLLKNG